MDFLQKQYHVIPLRDYIRAQREGRPLPYYSAVLTLDDGFRNFLTVAAPLLAARKLPATVFLITDRAGEKSDQQSGSTWTPGDDHGYLSWEEARLLQQTQDVEFGSHTCSHSGLLTISGAESSRELQHSYNDLVSHMSVENPTLSYPKGQYSTLLAEVALFMVRAGSKAKAACPHLHAAFQTQPFSAAPGRGIQPSTQVFGIVL